MNSSYQSAAMAPSPIDIHYTTPRHNDELTGLSSSCESAFSTSIDDTWIPHHSSAGFFDMGDFSETVGQPWSGYQYCDRPYPSPNNGLCSEYGANGLAPVEFMYILRCNPPMAMTDDISSDSSSAEYNSCSPGVSSCFNVTLGLENDSTNADFQLGTSMSGGQSECQFPFHDIRGYPHHTPDQMNDGLENPDQGPLLFPPLPGTGTFSTHSGSPASSVIHIPVVETVREPYSTYQPAVPKTSLSSSSSSSTLSSSSSSILECGPCRIRFRRRQDLKRHNGCVHSGCSVKMHSCDYCKKHFSRRDSKLRHMRKSCALIKYQKQNLRNAYRHTQSFASVASHTVSSCSSDIHDFFS